MNLPPTPTWDTGPSPQAGPRMPPRFVPTLTEVLPAPSAVAAAGAEAMAPHLVEASAPVEHAAPPYVSAPVEAPPSQPPEIDLALVQSQMRDEILAELLAALPAMVDEALAPRLRAAISEAMPELNARMREHLERQVARVLDDPRLSRAGPSSGAAD